MPHENLCISRHQKCIAVPRFPTTMFLANESVLSMMKKRVGRTTSEDADSKGFNRKSIVTFYELMVLPV